MPTQPVICALAGLALSVPAGIPTAAAQSGSMGSCAPRQMAQLLSGSGDCGLSGCRLGYAVALSADGNTALVGAYAENNSLGAAYVFVRSAGQWVMQGAKLAPIDGAGAVQYFGSSVKLSADGNTALIGAYGDNTSKGAVYIFTRSGSTWTQQGSKLTATGGSGSVWYFGKCAALTPDGNTAIIGAEGDNGYAGAAYIFVRSGGVWSQQAKLIDSGGIGVVRWFGNAVSIRADGSAVLVGAYADNGYLGAAYYFERSGTTWSLVGPKILPTGGVGAPQYFGSSIALSADGNTGLIGAYGDDSFIGAAYSFSRSGATWTQQQKLVPTGLNGAAPGVGRFGFTMSMQPDAKGLIVGAPADSAFTGTAYQFTRSTGATWTQRGAKMARTTTTGSGELGFSVATCADGSCIILGADAETGGAGAGYVFGPPCPGDFNCSNTHEVDDLLGFINAWLARDMRADTNGDGVLDLHDIFAYCNAWFSRC